MCFRGNLKRALTLLNRKVLYILDFTVTHELFTIYFDSFMQLCKSLNIVIRNVNMGFLNIYH